MFYGYLFERGVWRMHNAVYRRIITYCYIVISLHSHSSDIQN